MRCRLGGAAVAVAFLALTAALLIWDLEHPGRFGYILTRPQWRSWLVRGGVILTGYAAVLGLHLVGGSLAAPGCGRPGGAGVPLAALAAIYTAYLFAQAKARDMWQSPLLPAHLLVQAGAAGAAALLLAAAWWQPGAVAALGWVLAGTCLAPSSSCAGEVTIGHPTEHARLAAAELTHGSLARVFWAGFALVAAGVAAPLAGAWGRRSRWPGSPPTSTRTCRRASRCRWREQPTSPRRTSR